VNVPGTETNGTGNDHWEALAWFRRVSSGQMRLADLTLNTVLRQFRAILRWKGVGPDGFLVHRGLCPRCGHGLELRRDVE